MRILADIEGISIIKFDERDIVRHKLVKRIVRAYEKEENNPPSPPDASVRYRPEGGLEFRTEKTENNAT